MIRAERTLHGVRRMLTFERIALIAAVGAALCGTASSPAHGGVFDPTKGKVVLDDAAVRVAFDGPESLSVLGVSAVFDEDFMQLTATPTTAWNNDAVTAIEGQGFLRLGREVSAVYLGLESAASQLQGRRVAFTMWVRPGGTLPVVEIAFTPRPLQSAVGEDFFRPIGLVRLQPTGRATSDGWRELSSGPVDFNLAGAVEARFIQILDERLRERSFFGVASNDDGETLIDGLEISDLGPKSVPDVACSLPTEAETCGAAGACVYGRCADARAVLGTPPAAGPVRAQYLERLAYRIDMMAGARYTQSVTAAFTTELRALASETDTAKYWSRYFRAFDDLGDGHVSAPSWRIGLGLGGGMCLNQAVADLLPAGAPTTAPMVFAAIGNHPAAANLQEGDILMSVDGLPPNDWLALADRYLRYAGDPAGRAFVVTEQLPEAAVAAGAVLTFARCQSTNGVPCEPNQLLNFTVNLGELVAPLWQGVELDWDSAPCDFRFRRDAATGNFFSGEYVGFEDLEGGTIRTIFINGVSGRRQWRTTMNSALANLPNLVLLDERTGNGGTFTGVSSILGPFWGATAQPFVELVPQLRPELDAQSLGVFVDCLTSQTGITCGNFGIRPLLDGGLRRGSGVDSRLAIVNGRDVSGNDFLPRALKARPTGQTRIFGPVPTFGAFGPIFSLSRIMQELSGGSVQIQDSLFVFTPNEQNFDFETGFGVPPDEVVLQRQSDALRGVDTILEAAKTWLRGGQQ